MKLEPSKFQTKGGRHPSNIGAFILGGDSNGMGGARYTCTEAGRARPNGLCPNHCRVNIECITGKGVTGRSCDSGPCSGLSVSGIKPARIDPSGPADQKWASTI